MRTVQFPMLAAGLLFLSLSPCPAHSQNSVDAAAVHNAFVGEWKGALRYRDYQDSTKFVTLPTLLKGTRSADSAAVTLDFTYDDGPGKTVRSSDRFSFNTRSLSVQWGPASGSRPPSLFAVRSASLDGELRMVLEMDGADDDRPARVRESFSITGDTIRILKEVQFSAVDSWLFRHEYRLSKVR